MWQEHVRDLEAEVRPILEKVKKCSAHLELGVMPIGRVIQASPKALGCAAYVHRPT